MLVGRGKGPRRQRRQKRIHVSNRLIVASAGTTAPSATPCCFVPLPRDSAMALVAFATPARRRRSDHRRDEDDQSLLIQLSENADADCPETRLVSSEGLFAALQGTTRSPCPLHPPPIHRTKIPSSPASTAQRHNIHKRWPKSRAAPNGTTSHSRQSSPLHPIRISLAKPRTIDTANCRSRRKRHLPHSASSAADKHPCLCKRLSQSCLPGTSKDNCPRT